MFRWFAKIAGMLLFIFLISGACNVFHPKISIEITFTIHKPADFVPSRQTVIWLEKPDGSFYKSLYVSEYMAYGGYLVPGICPEWSDKAEWQNIAQEEFDAVTGATPATGKVDIKFKYSKKDLPEGDYILYLEIHLTENYNVLCQTKLSLNGNKGKTSMDMKYVPGKYSKLKGDYISDIKVIYK